MSRTPPPEPGDPSGARSFQSQLQNSVRDLSSVLEALIAQVGGVEENSLKLSRRLGVHKNLAWKAAGVAASRDLSKVVAQLPGSSGLEQLFAAFAKAGADAETVRAARAAAERFEEMTRRHSGDRATLDLMVGSAALEGADDPLFEAGRKQAFLGNSSIFGVRAKVRFGLQFAAPASGGGELIDLAAVGGMRGFQRLRASACWPLSFNLYRVQDEHPRSVPIERSLEGVDGPAFLLDHCSRPMPEIRGVRTDEGTIYALESGPVGKTGAFDCAFGWFLRAGEGAYAEHPPEDAHRDDVLGFNMPVCAPVELATMDAYVHRDLFTGAAPTVEVLSLMEHGLGFEVPSSPWSVLPLPVDVRELGTAAKASACPYVPGLPRMVAQVCERLDWRLEEFLGFRYEIRYPAIPTTVVLRFAKPRREG